MSLGITRDVLFKQGIQCFCTEFRVVRNFFCDRHKACEFLSAFVCEQSWYACNFHFCFFVVQFHEADGYVGAGECSDALLDHIADFGLFEECQRANSNKVLQISKVETYRIIIYIHHYDSGGLNSLNRIQISLRINRRKRAILTLTGARISNLLALCFVL